MRCKNCGAFLEKADRNNYWVHLMSGKFRCDGGWFNNPRDERELAQPDLFTTYLEELISAPPVPGQKDHYHKEGNNEKKRTHNTQFKT